MKRGVVVFVLLACIGHVSAAQISGEIYDLSLDLVSDVVVEIDTEPAQRMVSKDGSYSFSVPPGKYTITAKKEIATYTYNAEENITVKEDGSYTIDLFLYPEMEIEQLPETDFDLLESERSAIPLLPLILIPLIIIIILVLRKKRLPKEPDDLEKILSIIKSRGGRATQKEIRKELPHSEAKISLMITELVHRGKVKKIKKGRGNIIVLKQ